VRGSGPSDDERDAESSFVKGALAGAEGGIGGDGDVPFGVGSDVSAVVAGEHDEGVPVDAEGAQAGHDATHAFVETADEGSVGGVAVSLVGFEE